MLRPSPIEKKNWFINHGGIKFLINIRQCKTLTELKE